MREINGAIEIIDPGMLTIAVSTVRHGRERFGLPRGGAMDAPACVAANRLAGNGDEAYALESLMAPPRLRALCDCTAAISGAEGEYRVLRGKASARVPMNIGLMLRAGDILTGEPYARGCRGYIAVRGGLLSRPLRAVPIGRGEIIPLGAPDADPPRYYIPPAPLPGESAVLRVCPGVNAAQFSPEGMSAFYGGEYVYLPQSDRMGIRLSGPRIAFAPGRDGNIISSGVLPGDIQVPASGQPIIMMADCQTVGGYARIAHVLSDDIPIAAQLRPGGRIRFERAEL